MEEKEFEKKYGEFVWDQRVYYQSYAVIYETERFHRVTVWKQKAFKFCPFNEFQDGFTFVHPKRGMLYDNEGATRTHQGETE